MQPPTSDEERFRPEALDPVRGLPEHRRVLDSLLSSFRAARGVVGLLLSGSTATGGTDEFSDLDIGVVCASEEDREHLWTARWTWDVPEWFHRFDADHVKPHFVIYLFDPLVKADIALYTKDDMPATAGRPYAVAWGASDELEAWARTTNSRPSAPPQDPDLIHDDDRFWAWMFYCWQHVARGEYVHVAREFFALREIVERWWALLAGRPGFADRRFELSCGDPAFLARIADCFPRPERSSLKKSCAVLMELQCELRERWTELRAPAWRTRPEAMERIANLVREL